MPCNRLVMHGMCRDEFSWKPCALLTRGGIAAVGNDSSMRTDSTGN